MSENELETTNLGETIDRLLEFKDTVPAPQRDVDFFSKEPWLKELFTGPDSPYKAMPFYARYKKPIDMHNFTARTAATSDTIPHCMALILRDEDRYLKLQEGLPADGKQRPFTAPAFFDFALLVDLKEGLNGFPGIAHGGVMSALLDEACANAAFMHRLPKRAMGHVDNMFTAGLNVSFLAPIETPCVFVVRAWVVRVEGRKWTVRGQIVSENSDVLIEAESLWLSSKREASL